ncbi:glutathione S-transferase U8-like [Magnolia sinica]|uniref:glutathione S-transferase U8-like n=1 Tax=Magnolia sinica TaxID=86752 RepID=UPI00265B5AD9|nr:glutathione S-transferase U8-like [Magnolia sinica]
MAEVALKVFGNWGSPFSRRVVLALKFKGIEYEYIEEDLSNKSPLLLQYNPVHKKVPVLLHNGKPIAESLVILEYIDEIWKEYPILPENPLERATARFWAKFVDEKCMLATWMACWSEGKEQEKFIEESLENLKTLESALNGKFFGGDSIGLVDITACYIAHWLGVLQEVVGLTLVDVEKFPILCKWIEDFMSDSVVKESMPPREKLLAFFKARKEAIFAAKAPVY